MSDKKLAIKLSTLEAIGEAVRSKEGSTELIPVNALADRITAIPKAKPEQEKTVDITENGTTEITADEGYTLSKVTANVNVKASGENNKFVQLVEKTITEITAEDLEGATKIGNFAFQNITTLKSITFPETITQFGTNAFQNTGLVNVVLPSSLRITNNSYPESLFQASKQLKSIVIPEGTMTMIPYSFCSNCTSLTSVNIPNSVTKIDNYAFSGCSSLTSLTIPAKVTTINSFSPLKIGSDTNKATLIFLPVKPPALGGLGVFSTSYLEKIIVPAGSGEAYKTASNWSAFADYIEEAME